MKLLIIGDSCTDIFVYGHSERLCPESPAPVFIPIDKKICGGMAKNVFNIMKKYKVKVDLITNDSDISKIRYIDQKSNYLFLRVDENDRCDRIKNIKKINFNNYDHVVISDYNKGYLKHEDIFLISTLHNSCFLDTKKQLGSWCENIKYIKINKKEYENNKNYLNDDLNKKLIVTLDSEGCMYNKKNYPTKKVKTPDRTGAGDCFMASLVYNYSATRSIVQSIKFANKMAYNYVIGKL